MIKKRWLDKHAPKPETEPYAEGTVKDLRLKLGLTQKELAELLEVTKSTIAGWEYANINPPEAIHKLQKMYDDAKDRIVDDGIDIIEKVSYIRHRRPYCGTG
ncbi:TPA: helix-turn-helix transcriptional regulator [Streptococcus suis]|nr:helix-turn-helix transcriptional regulator [Streptococcus suis]HEM6320273.1 helix-turn-helix transcriptional regulator [Streptococcus suis]